MTWRILVVREMYCASLSVGSVLRSMTELGASRRPAAARRFAPALAPVCEATIRAARASCAQLRKTCVGERLVLAKLPAHALGKEVADGGRMIPPKTILVPTDFSETAQKALDYAVELAEKLGAKLQVIHAFELPLVGFPDGTLTITAEMATRITVAAQKALDEVVAKYKGRPVELMTSLVQGDPRELVLEAARKLGADLIVMGTHGRRGIARALIGSVAESVVRTSSIPVLTLREARDT